MPWKGHFVVRDIQVSTYVVGRTFGCINGCSDGKERLLSPALGDNVTRRIIVCRKENFVVKGRLNFNNEGEAMESGYDRIALERLDAK